MRNFRFKIKHFIYITILLQLTIYQAHPITLLGDKKAARVNNQIILVTEVEEHAEKYSLSYEEALNQLIEEALLFFGAKISTDEPTEEVLDKKIREDRSIFASRIGKRVSEVTDDEFLVYIISNFGSKKNYVEKVKKSIWIMAYLDEAFSGVKVKETLFSQEQVETFIKENPQFFQEKEGVRLSMINFSYFNSEGKPMSRADLDKQKERSAACLLELQEGGDFRKMVLKYSDDNISRRADPAGYVGPIYFDDPRTYENLSREIVNDLKNIKEPGLIPRVYATGYGIFIFYIDGTIKPRLINEDRALMKARDILRIRKERELQNKLRKKMILDLKKKADIVIY